MGDASKVMKFLVQTMEEDELSYKQKSSTSPKESENYTFCRSENPFSINDRQVTEQQMVSAFVKGCGIGHGSNWKGIIIMPTSTILAYMRDIVHDILHLQLELGDVRITQTASSTIVVTWQSGEELRLEACHCAKALHHLRGCYYCFLGFVHPDGLSSRTRMVARALLRPLNGQDVTIYEA
ncbi:hypothetical protein OMDBNIEC_00062 [Salmonella phage STP-SP5]|nr:hypothetical protein OMDBNIEC_00062 [Salmonella phage STP-SP5]